ncbi:4,4'-diaponeurosporenoate glycosyltransferase [Planctomycetes bacterium Pan216]|uniref:4,4'-diaponeurosporenoate glycosyltransferase n=2 Tax=Kolteria novifilia TaxID=2527975 RepID=A0A518BBH3_9BACT|nr:4,4'-diaponeurosporenoate glycosyltransferase [Planctomycetes bacterium Pan216]
MIVPARNEEKELPRTLPTLLQQDYPELSITIINDRSEDRTGDLLAEAAEREPRLRILEGIDRPAGWVGKTWVLHQGVLATRSEWILFVDADIRLSDDAVRIAVMEATRREVDLFSIVPNVECETFWQRTSCLAMATALTVVFPLVEVNDPRKSTAIAAGGFFLIRRRVHEALGSEEAVKGEIGEDLKRAQCLKLAGYRMHLAASRRMASTHWYGTLADIWTGLRKNAYAGFEFNPWFFLSLSAIGLTVVWTPVIALVAGLLGIGLGAPLAAATFALGAVGWLFQALTAVPMIVHLGIPWWHAALMPFAYTLYNLIAFTSAYDYHFGGGPRWKSRSFDPADFRAPSGRS